MNLHRLTAAAYFIATSLAVLCYLGSVRSTAVLTYLLPAVGIAAFATTAPRKSTSYSGLLSGLVFGIAWAVVVNILSGEYLGPVARSTTACVVGTTLVVFGIRHRQPNTSLVGELVIIAGALYYGAANEIWKLAIVAVAFHLVGHFGASQATQKRQPRALSWRSLLMLLLLLLAGTTIIFVTSWNLPAIFNLNGPRQSVVLSKADISPPWKSPENTTTTVANVPVKTDALIQESPNSVIKPDVKQVEKNKVDWLSVLKIVGFFL
jgi:hypothetical protein